MSAHEPSSLDRFLWGRGQDLLDQRYRVDATWSCLSGLAQILAGTALIVFVMASQPETMWIIVLFGALLVATGALQLRASRQRLRAGGFSSRSLVAVSPEGQRLLHKVCSHIGYYDYQGEAYGRSIAGLRGYRTASQVLPEHLFTLLNEASWQHNRIEGLLMERASATDGNLKALQPNVRAAAIEAMALVVNHAAWIDTFPENEADHAKTIQSRTEQLQELADRIGKLVGSRPTLVDSLAARTLMDDVLDRLRLDEVARGELSQPEESPTRSR